MTTHEKLTAFLETLPKGELLMRGDSVAFPPGGCAYQHRHQGPGIRCLIEGGIRIDTHGRSTSFGPGGAWYESGPDAVFAQASPDKPSRFIRVMILPRELPAPAGNAAGSGLDRDRLLTLPGFALVERRAGDLGRPVHDENEARQRRQPELDVLGAGQHVFI
jgi:hypothetical protein